MDPKYYTPGYKHFGVFEVHLNTLYYAIISNVGPYHRYLLRPLDQGGWGVSYQGERSSFNASKEALNPKP